MKSPWSPLLTPSIAAAAIFPLNVAVASGTPDSGRAVAMLDAVTLATLSADGWLQLNAWISDSYHRAPALILVLAVLIALPPLALAGLMLRWPRRSPDTTVLLPRSSARRAEPRPGTLRAELSAWPTEAWVEVAETGTRHVIGRTMVRIGREADNDIGLMEKTVHRYHAVIRRTGEGDVVVTDLSGADGNGVLINGTRITEARLKPGDVISIGEVKLKFDARPV